MPRMSFIRFELRIFDGLIGRAAVIQLPVLPLIDPHSRWIGGHYCDEFAEAHIKELVVREAIGAAIPLAGVGCAIARGRSRSSAARQDGKPFAGTSMTEDYELGLRFGALGLKTMFVRIPASRASGRRRQPRPFPATLGQRCGRRRAGSAASRCPGGIGSAGMAGWASAGCGCATAVARSRLCLLFAAYGAALLWSQIWLAHALGAPVKARLDPGLATLLTINGWPARMASADARLFHGLGLRIGSGAAVNSTPPRWQRHRHARCGARGFAAPRRRRQALGQDPAYFPGRLPQ